MQTIALHTESANLTEDQFFMLCVDNKDLRIERDKHKNIIIMAPTGTNTGKSNAEILGELIIWNRKNKTGRAAFLFRETDPYFSNRYHDP